MPALARTASPPWSLPGSSTPPPPARCAAAMHGLFVQNPAQHEHSRNILILCVARAMRGFGAAGSAHHVLSTFCCRAITRCRM